MIEEVDEKRGNLRKGVYILPNLITTGGLFAGFYGIIASIQDSFHVAAWFILVSAVFDVLDGKVARLTGTTSRFGVEYDSLSDLVAFGVAPGILMYSWALEPFGRFGWLAAFLYVVCGALRLARFNVQANTVESKHFIGLPIPAAACTVASCVLLFYYLGGAGTIRMVSVVVLIYALAFLMVSNITFYSFKDPALFRRRPFWNLVLAVFIVLIIVARPEVMIFIVCLIYTLFTPVIAGMAQLRKYRRGKAEV